MLFHSTHFGWNGINSCSRVAGQPSWVTLWVASPAVSEVLGGKSRSSPPWSATSLAKQKAFRAANGRGLEPSNAARCGKGQKVCDDLGMGQYASGRIWIIYHYHSFSQTYVCDIVWYHVINNFTNGFHQHQAIHMYIYIYTILNNIIQYVQIIQNISNFSRFCYDMLWPPSAPRCSTSLSVAWPWTVDSCGTYIAGYYWFAMLCHLRKVTMYLIPSSRISQRLSK